MTHDNGAYVKVAAGRDTTNDWLVQEVQRGEFTVEEIAVMMESLGANLKWKLELAERVE